MTRTLDLTVYLLILLIHVHVVILEMVLWKTCSPRVFHVAPEKTIETTAMTSNQGLYNDFPVVALVIGLITPDPVINTTFALFSLIYMAMADIQDAVAVDKRIFFVQMVPTTTALALE